MRLPRGLQKKEKLLETKIEHSTERRLCAQVAELVLASLPEMQPLVPYLTDKVLPMLGQPRPTPTCRWLSIREVDISALRHS